MRKRLITLASILFSLEANLGWTSTLPRCGAHVTARRLRTIFASGTLILVSGIGFSQSEFRAQLSPADLVKAVIRSEANPSDVSESRWKYLLEKEVDGKQETREVVETKLGSPDRLVAIGGSPLTDAQQRDETERILRLSHSPEEQHKLEQTHLKDAAQCNVFLRMIPEAFLFEYAGERGGLTKLIFRPNPRFQPSSREGKVLHEMAGEIWIDTQHQRLVSISGQLTNEVKFGRGLLGRLEKGGEFRVKRAEIVPGHWEIIEIVVNMRGKALLFKTISVQQKELHSSFQPVPNDLSLSDAAGLLLKETLVAAKR
jgi:hypothetical protein